MHTTEQSAPDVRPAIPLEIVVSGVEPENALAIRTAFQPFVAQVSEWQAKVATVTDPKIARASRLLLKKIRVEAEHKKDDVKKSVLAYTKAVDATFRSIAGAIEPMEDRLLEIETAAERAEAARKKALSDERAAQLEKYGVDSTFFQLSEMPDEAFAKLLDTSRAGFEAKAAAEAKRIDEARIAADKAEAERIAKEVADAADRERVRAENERLKREAEEREVSAKAERERLEREKAQVEAKAKAEREAAEAKAREERRKADEVARVERERAANEKAELERKAAQERAARERLEREAAERRAAEEKRQREEAEAAARAAAAPDREKLRAFAAIVRTLEVPAMDTRAGKVAAARCRELVEELACEIEGTAARMNGRAAA